MVQIAIHHMFGDRRSLACRDESNMEKNVPSSGCKLPYSFSNVVFVSAILHVLGLSKAPKVYQRAVITFYWGCTAGWKSNDKITMVHDLSSC
jgi:hypothetical protein